MAAFVEVVQHIAAAVEDEHVTRLDHEVTVGGADVPPVPVDAEHDDALAAQARLAECSVGDPVVVADVELTDVVVGVDLHEAGVVAHLEPADPAEQDGEQPADASGDSRRRRQNPDQPEAAGEHEFPLGDL